MATKAQEWARKRNSSKWLLTGVQSVINNLLRYKSPLTQREAAHLEAALDIVDNILLYWKKGNRESKKTFMESDK